jgi:hypothetical protein
MLHDEDRDQPAPDAEAKRLRDTVRQLVLMKETGPKSAAWHRARVQTIWRLQRRVAAIDSGGQAEQGQQAEAQDDPARQPVDPPQAA